MNRTQSTATSDIGNDKDIDVKLSQLKVGFNRKASEILALRKKLRPNKRDFE